MKKLLALILGLTMAMATLTACNKGQNTDNSSTTSESVEVKTYTVTFKQMGEVDVTMTVKKGESIATADIPAPKEKEGYTVAWKATDIAKLSNITENIVVEAELVPNTYTVTFVVGDGVTYPATKDVVYNADYTFALPSRVGYNCTGWVDSDGKVFAPSGKWTIAKNMTLTAEWVEVQVEKVTVSFMQPGQDSVQYEIVKGSTFTGTIPEIVGKTGYTVVWNATDLAKLNGAINENVTVNVTETPKTYTVTFVDDEGIVTTPATVTYDQAYDFTPTSAPVGYHFKGFTRNDEPFATNDARWTIDEDITLKVVWEEDAKEEDDDGNWTKNY